MKPRHTMKPRHILRFEEPPPPTPITAQWVTFMFLGCPIQVVCDRWLVSDLRRVPYPVHVDPVRSDHAFSMRAGSLLTGQSLEYASAADCVGSVLPKLGKNHL